jgi:hypothetical protein
MAEMRKSGSTLDEIGATYGVTRERVRQLLKKYDLDIPKEQRYGAFCNTCDTRLLRGQAMEHRKTHIVRLGHAGLTPEAEMRNEYIAEAYLRGDRIQDISRTVRTRNDTPTTYTAIYRILRDQGIEPNRGAGRYKRTLEGRERYRTSLREGSAPYRGWRAPDDE